MVCGTSETPFQAHEILFLTTLNLPIFKLKFFYAFLPFVLSVQQHSLELKDPKSKMQKETLPRKIPLSFGQWSTEFLFSQQTIKSFHFIKEIVLHERRVETDEASLGA
jgi:hypothetical protein